MKQSTLKANTGTNLIVRMAQELVNDGWEFEVKDDKVTSVYNEELNKRIFFDNAGELKSWIELKSEDY